MNKQINEKIIQTCCFECGKKYGTKKDKGAIEIWRDTCDICHSKNVYCASASHDFGIYSNDEIRKNDKLQDLI